MHDPNFVALIDSRRQMSPCQALIGRGHDARTLRPRREEWREEGGKYQNESLLTVRKNWISSSPSPPSAMAAQEPAQTREATADCRQKRDAAPLEPILAWSSSTAI